MATRTANEGELGVGLDERPGVEAESPFVALLRDLVRDLCDDGRVVATLQQGVDPSPASLRQWLVDFVAHPVLQATLTELARFAEEPVEAYLRTFGPNVRSRDDGIVEVSAADQERLDRAAVNTELDLVVRATVLAGAGALDPASSYETLDSAGLALSVLHRTTMNSGSLTLRVRKA